LQHLQPALHFRPPQRVDQYLGGDSYETRTVRADAVWQASDHYQIQGGLYGAQHAIGYSDVTSYRSPSGLLRLSRDAYRVNPLEFASYVQSLIERDAITIHAGLRFDFASTGGFAFNDPSDPMNGTTAREVCNGEAPGISETAFRYDGYTGFAACEASPQDENGHRVLMDSASRLAQLDDFHPVRSRATVSPRVSVRIPLTERTEIYMNAGRFSAQPRYHDAFRHTHTGLRVSENPADCPGQRGIAGTNSCSPAVGLESTLPDFLGNPDLASGRSTMWEAGMVSRLGRLHSLEMSYFSGTRSLLPVLTTARLDDPGNTYGSINDMTLRTVENLGATSSFGLSMTLRLESPGAFSYVVSYSWQETTELGLRPDFAAEAFAAGVELGESLERVPGAIRPHSLSAQLKWQWGQRIPSGLGVPGRVFLRDSHTTLTVAMASASGVRPLDESTCAPGSTRCEEFGQRLPGTGILMNLLYVRALNRSNPVVSITLRIRNLLDANDGSAALVLGNRNFIGVPGRNPENGNLLTASRRRVLTGLQVVF
jgi:hypothetical protein